MLFQMVKRRVKEELDRKLQQQRAVFIEKAKTINIEPIPDERQRKTGFKVTLAVSVSDMYYVQCLSMMWILAKLACGSHQTDGCC